MLSPGGRKKNFEFKANSIKVKDVFQMYFCSSWHFKQQTPDLWHLIQVREGGSLGKGRGDTAAHSPKAPAELPFSDPAVCPGLCMCLPQSTGIMTEPQLLPFSGLS